MEITQNGEEEWTLAAFETCEDDNGDMIGSQYTLSDLNGNTVELDAMGDMSGQCRRLELNGPVDSIIASFSTRTSSVSAIRYIKDPNQVTYGILLNSTS